MRTKDGKFAKGSKHLVRHGKSKTKIYRIWSDMRSRCQNANNAAYVNYGGRGIKVCDKWEDFEAFYADMGEPPKGLSLDRIDNDGPYSPDNCRWADRKTQARNRRHGKKLTLQGETLTVAEWAERSGLAARTIRARLRNGWEPLAAVFGRKVQRKGIPRGERLRDHQAYGDQHGVQWSEPGAQ